MQKLSPPWQRVGFVACFVVLAVVFFLPTMSQAQTDATSTTASTTTIIDTATTTPTSSAGTIVETNTISGTFVSSDGNSLNISTDNGMQTFVADNTITVRRDGELVDLVNLQAGDEITATVTSTGTVLSIVATSSGATDTASAIWPIAIVILILLILGFWLWSKARRAPYRYQKVRE